VAQRTYLVGLYIVFNTAYRYISRYQNQLEGSATEEQFACIQAVLTALEACLPLIKPSPPTP
jgi:hypothetical protein